MNHATASYQPPTTMFTNKARGIYFPWARLTADEASFTFYALPSRMTVRTIFQRNSSHGLLVLVKGRTLLLRFTTPTHKFIVLCVSRGLSRSILQYASIFLHIKTITHELGSIPLVHVWFMHDSMYSCLKTDNMHIYMLLIA